MMWLNITDGSLKIPDIVAADEGDYTCTLDGGSSFHGMELHVEGGWKDWVRYKDMNSIISTKISAAAVSKT